MIRFWFVFLLLGLSAVAARGGEPAPSDKPRPIPLTRPEMKQALEDMKSIKPRIPLPELTEDEKQALGERERGYEGRLRSVYLGEAPRGGSPAGTSGGAFPREQDPNMTLGFAFKTSLFWIVSRANNCHY